MLCYYIATKQNAQFQEDQTTYQHAIQLLVNENYEQALKHFENIEDRNQNNHLLNWNKGWALGQMGEFGESLEYFILAQEQNPVLTRDPIFVLQFVWVMLNTQNLFEAQLYLEHIKQLRDINEEQLNLANEWLEYIFEVYKEG